MKNVFLVALHLVAGAMAAVMTYPMRSGASCETFTKRFSKDNLFRIDTRTRELLERVSGCISCGRCEAYSAGSGRPGLRFPVNSADFIMDTRSIDNVDLLSYRLREMKSFDLEKMEETCPAGIPFTELVDLVEELVEGSEKSRP
jgi:succinate dehydrogenase/fumarate reductase-like Fe-S protein